MKFKADKTQNTVEIGELNIGNTFVDLKNFSEGEVFIIINDNGYDCHVDFEDGVSEIAVVNLTTGELWSYTRDEEVIPIEMEEITYKRQ